MLEETLSVRGTRRGGELAPGAQLGAYRLVSLIGEGGIGLVYLAEHTKLERRVALKILRKELASNPRMVSRFFGEARAVNAIAHENIVEITDFVEGDPSGGVPSHYIMELLSGRTLRDLLDDGPLPIERTIAIGIQIAGALAAAHEKEVIHRDLKPENVFLVTDRRRTDFVKLLDFGAAKLSESLRAGEPSTRAGVLIGTPRYMSPEQILGDQLDPRADLYALGAVLFEMTTGRPLFLTEDIGEILRSHVEEEAARPSSATIGREPIPRALDNLILQCLDKVPERRPRSALEVARRLVAILDARRRRRGLPAVALAAAALAIVAAASAPPETPAPPEPPAVQPVRVVPEIPQVTLHFESEPAGAQVFREGTAGPIGRTPFERSFPPGGEVRFRFEMARHRSAEQVVMLDRDARVKVALAAVEAPKKQPRPAKKRSKRPKAQPAPLSKGVLRNPFQ